MRMKKPAEFASLFKKGDHFIAPDVKDGYHFFFLHESIREYFPFHFPGRYFCCIVLSFAWCRATFWFVNMMKSFVGKMRKWDYRILEYVDDFIISASIGRPSTGDDCQVASENIEWLMRKTRLARRENKGVWGKGATCVDHLGFTWDSMSKKQEKVKAHARSY